MDIFEFELRFRSYEGLAKRFDLGWDEAQILRACKKSDQGKLEKKIQDASLEELWTLTRATYTDGKKELIKEYKDKTINGKSAAEYIERLEYEFKVIDEMGYNTYFLIVQDYINRAREHQIVVGPGRGSCAGSLLSYVIGITDIEPLTYDLIFERFLNPGRISMPDIDTDFEDTLRDQVIKYMIEVYGEDNVAHIGTYMTMAAKAAFKDVARVYGIKFTQANKLSGLITEKTIEKSVANNKELQETIASDSRVRSVVEVASKLEGTVRQTGVHACGMIIAPKETTHYTPIQYPPKSGSKGTRDTSKVVSQYEGPIIETVGLLKMDVLGLRNLSIIKHTIKILAAQAKVAKKEVNPLFQEFLDTMLFHPPLNDETTYKKIFHTGDTSGVFQFESDGMKQWMKKLKPTHFDDLIAMVSLYRPGPMEFIPAYIDRKHEIEKISYMGSDLYTQLEKEYGEEIAKSEKEKLKKDLQPFMEITYGIAVYQEQLMRLVQAMAGFSMSEADKLRKGVGKKIREVIEKVKKEFVAKAQSYKDYKPETAVWVYEKMIEPAADYSFNKSHAACYAYIAYQTAWLKAHYPIAFHAALLRSVEEDTDKLAKFVDEIKLQGYPITLPSVNTSFEHVAAVDDTIVLGFRSIKGVGSDIALHIEEDRMQNGPYADLPDFLTRNSDYINKKSLESLVKSGALDEFYDRFTLIENTGRMLDWIKASSSKAATNGLFAMEAVEGSDLVLETAQQGTLIDRLKTEKAMFKTFISGHPLDGLYPYIRSKFNLISMFKDKEDYGEYTLLGYVKGINRGMRGGFFLKVEDISGEIEIYLHERLDVKPFDLVGIKGWKGRSARIDEIMIYTHAELVEKVTKKNLYDPEKTVKSVRRERMESNKKQAAKATIKQTSLNNNAGNNTDNNDHKKPSEKTNNKAENNPNNTKNNNQHPTNTNPSTQHPENPRKDDSGPLLTKQKDNKKTAFASPDSIQLLQKVTKILKTYPGEIPIKIGSMRQSVNNVGLDKLRGLLA